MLARGLGEWGRYFAEVRAHVVAKFLIARTNSASVIPALTCDDITYAPNPRTPYLH